MTNKADSGPLYFGGIDPGKQGAVVVLDRAGSLVAHHRTPMIGSEYDVRAMADLVNRHRFAVAIERAQYFSGDGGPSAFTNGMGWGLWRGILTTLEIPFEIVVPKDWQRVARRAAAAGARGGKAKAMAAAAAQARWPDLPVTGSQSTWCLSDSAWLAETARGRMGRVPSR